MKLTIFKPQLPGVMATSRLSPAASQDVFAQKLSALRLATGRPERFVSLCACAIHDKAFQVVYERCEADRPFVIAGIYKDGEGGDDAREAARLRSSKTLPASSIDTTGWRCPHCEDKGGRSIACDKCGTTVCGGRTRAYPGTADVFECRSSCGRRGTLKEAELIKGVEEVRKAKA